MGTISQHQVTTFTSPSNGQSPIDATVVKGNDNTLKTSHNAHDSDATIHLQNGTLASRPSAGSAGSMWLATDTSAVYAYLDTGAAWAEINYLRNTGGTVTGSVVVTGATTSRGGFISGVAGSGTGGSYVSLSDDGVQRWLAGIGGNAGDRAWILYDAVNAGIRLSVHQTTGVLTVGTGLTVTAGGATITAGGLTVTAGTTAVQALTGTTFAFTGGGSYASAASAANATTGFFYVNSCPSTPTGVPSGTPSGQIPVLFDSTNNKFYAYLNGAWKSVTLA